MKKLVIILVISLIFLNSCTIWCGTLKNSNEKDECYLDLSKEKKIESGGMGGKYIAYETQVGVILGRGGREVDFGFVSVVFPEEELDVPILIGRIPVFEEFQVVFEEYKKKFKLIPREEIIAKEKKASKASRKKWGKF